MSDLGERGTPETNPNLPPTPLDPQVQARLLVDYQETVGVVRQLTDVRFKLAAFVPTLTAAAAALLSTSNVELLSRGMLAIGGLGFAFGIILYDLRNTQLYNSAIGRATALETRLFEPYGGDSHAGVFGSRTDTTDNMKATQRDQFRFFRGKKLPVRHGPGLSLVYSAVVAVWMWVLLDAGTTGLERWTEEATAAWQTWIHDYVAVLPVVAAAVVARWFYKEHRRTAD